jgi:hypothetical protein
MFNLFKKTNTPDNKKELFAWLNNINLNSKPTNDVKAYWFGLFETPNGYTIYLTGSNTYDENDSDWACNVDFAPKEKYMELGLKGYKWEDVLKIAIDLVKSFIESEDYKKHFISKADHIAIGFDDGDLIKII